MNITTSLDLKWPGIFVGIACALQEETPPCRRCCCFHSLHRPCAHTHFLCQVTSCYCASFLIPLNRTIKVSRSYTWLATTISQKLRDVFLKDSTALWLDYLSQCWHSVRTVWFQFTMLQCDWYRLQHIKQASWQCVGLHTHSSNSNGNLGKLVRLCNKSHSSPPLIHAASSLSLSLSGNNTLLFFHKILNNPKRGDSLLSFSPQRRKPGCLSHKWSIQHHYHSQDCHPKHTAAERKTGSLSILILTIAEINNPLKSEV